MILTPRHARAGFAALLSLAVVAGGGCGKRGGAGGAGGGEASQAAPVVVTPIVKGVLFDRIEALGTARANESVTITAKVTEIIEAVHFQDGQFVKAGDVLVDLTRAEEEAQLAEAQVELRDEKLNLDRLKQLADIVTPSELDTASARYASAQARVNAIQARLADRRITAPFSGVLGMRNVSPGSLISPGTPITTLDDIGTLKLDFSVPEVFVSTLKPGLVVRAGSIAFPGRTFEGKVSTVNARIDPVTRAALVRAEVANPEHTLRPGMLMKVDLLSNQREALLVPEAAILQRQSRQFVLVVAPDNSIKEVEVKLGARRPGFAELLEGLQPRERVIVEGLMRARPGGGANVLREEPPPAGDQPAANTAGKN